MSDSCSAALKITSIVQVKTSVVYYTFYLSAINHILKSQGLRDGGGAQCSNEDRGMVVRVYIGVH